MKLPVNSVTFLSFLLATAGCTGASLPVDAVSAIQIDGATFEIGDAAVASNCLSMTFAVRGNTPSPEMDPQLFFPPAKGIQVNVVALAGHLAGRPLGGGGGGGDEEDGRVWMEQQLLYSLDGPVSEGEEVTLEIMLTLDDDFGRTEPLQFRIPLVAAPGGGICA